MASHGEIASQRGEQLISQLTNTSLNINQLQVKGNGTEGNKKIHYYQDGKLRKEIGQFFVSMPDSLSELLNGSYISPDIFMRELKKIDAFNKPEIKKRLIGDFESNGWSKALIYAEDNFTLKIFHGSTHENALQLVDIAETIAQGDLDEQIHKAEYQDTLLKVVSPVITEPNHNGKPALRVVEDCLASGDSIMGVLTALYQKTKFNEISKVRVDVAVATAQGILLLKKYAQDNGIELDLNVGYLAYGLSKGVKTQGSAYEHANYITFPDPFLAELDEYYSNGFTKRLKGKYVVGDMGDNGKKPEDLEYLTPWYTDVIKKPEIVDGQYPVMVYLANGGYLMRGYTHYLLGEEKLKDASEIIFSAKRRFDEGSKGDGKGLGYGVLIYGISETLLN